MVVELHYSVLDATQNRHNAAAFGSFRSAFEGVDCAMPGPSQGGMTGGMVGRMLASDGKIITKQQAATWS